MNIEAINEQLLRAIGSGIAVVGEHDLDFRFVNEQFSNWFGEPEPATGLAELFPGIDIEMLRTDLAAGRAHSVEISIKPKRRMLVIAMVLSRAVSNDEPLLVVECQNITRIRELESMIDSYAAMVERNTRTIEREKERAERLLLIEVITRTANEATSIEDVMRITLDRVCNHTQWTVGHIYMLDPPSKKLLFGENWHLGDTQRFETFRLAGEAFDQHPEDGLPAQVVAGRKARWIADVTREEDTALGEMARHLGFKGAFAFPVLVGERVVAVLEFFSEEPAEHSEALLQLMTQICAQLGRVVQRLQAQEQMLVAKEAALDAAQAKSTFLANMSHELRTPMNAIIGFTRLVMRQTETLIPDKQYENLAKILTSSQYLLELINQLLDLSKIEAGKFELFLESYDVADLLHETAAAVQPLAKEKGNRLEVQCDKNLGFMHADKTRVRQIVLNLLSNACKFTEGGEVMITATRTDNDGTGWLHLAVSDSGIGMTPEESKRVFEAFTQAQSADARKYGGTGLGLTISRQLCHMMGGDIDLTSQLGVGTTFTVRLPLAVEVSAQTRGDLRQA